jgi:aminopeptidase N
MFDDRVYQRGALTLHAMRLAVGDAVFFDMLRSWTATHAHGSVSTQDFLDCASRHFDGPLQELLQAWLFRPELPPLISPWTSTSST